MTIDLGAVSPTGSAAAKHLCLSRDIGVIIFDLCGAPFHEDVGPTTADQAAFYAERIRWSLDDGEFERVFAMWKRNCSVEDAREAVEEYARFCEGSGGYTMWV